MTDLPSTPHPSPPHAGGEDVRVLQKPREQGVSSSLWLLLATSVLVLSALAWWWTQQHAESATRPSAHLTADETPARATLAASSDEALGFATEYDRPSAQARVSDPNDLASYFKPGDAAPSAASVITALHQSGIRTGMGAFNPPGTSPPLEGLAVPEDFVLPEGYVRHHQVTDEGVTIEPILMFSPELTLRDAQGRLIALPANGVVPPELAPPGLPLRWIRPGSP